MVSTEDIDFQNNITNAINTLTAYFFSFFYIRSPILSIAQYGSEVYVDGTNVHVCLTAVDTFWPSFFFVGSISIFFVLPFVILVVLYTVIAKHLMNNPGITSHGNRSNVLKYRKQVIFMLGAVVLSFFICLLPFRALTLWIIVVPSETIMSLGIDGYYSLLYFCRIMLYLNSAMNPILYNLMSSKFRDGFLKLLQCRGLVNGKFLPGGTRKGTFNTTSTNLSSSQSGDKRSRSGRPKEVEAKVDGAAGKSKVEVVVVGGELVVGALGQRRPDDTVTEADESIVEADVRASGTSSPPYCAQNRAKSLSHIDFRIDSATILSLLKSNSLDETCGDGFGRASATVGQPVYEDRCDDVLDNEKQQNTDRDFENKFFFNGKRDLESLV